MKTMLHSCRPFGWPSFAFLRKVSFLLLFCFIAIPSFPNNTRILGTVKVSESSSHSDTLLLSFTLRWDHSWRDGFNWDAAWVFLKYKTASGAWQPVYLSPGGHRFTDASGSALPFGSMEGETDGKTVGLFIYRTTLESGNTPEIRCHLLCPRSSLGGLPAEAFQRNEAFVLAQGIEMVYIPYGAYYAGDSSSFHTIADAGGHPILVDSEGSVSLSAGGSSYTLSSSYPKGYKGFYVMKYEVSQEQYVTFLNNLTYTQQQERVPGLASFSKGDYIFGDASRPSCRNGIIVAALSEDGSPVIFANNLNNDGRYSQADDGKTLACNYLSPEDMIAYLSWSGLRPMSELEYEKACRAPYPEMPLEKEYAWHEDGSLTFLASVSNGGSGSERSNTTGANVNAGNRFSGPVRCGLFATGSSSQRDAGASFWGVMEMSGNLRELCYNVSAANAFSGDVYGDGTYKRVNWSTVVSHFGIRGGGFSSEDSLLRVSDRSEAENYFTSLTQRDSTVGFRGVRRIGNMVSFDMGGLVCQNGLSVDTTCVGAEIRLRDVPPSHNVGNISYVWYISEDNGLTWTLMEGAGSADLIHSSFENTTSGYRLYKFKRKATCAVGEAETEVSVYVMPLPWTVNSEEFINPSGAVQITSAVGTGLNGSWTLQGAPSELSISGTGQISGIPSDMIVNFRVEVVPGKCPDKMYEKEIIFSRVFFYTGSEQSITLLPGKYKMECWGASGWYSTIVNGETVNGRGAYVKGEIQFSQNQGLYIFVGQPGNHRTPSFNGNLASSTTGSGGGASDIRLTGGSWNDFSSLKSRIIIAAGGGGHDRGGAAGGLKGYDGGNHPSPGSGFQGYGATQVAGGGRGVNGGYVGTFGMGGLGRNYSDGHSGGGGGGGYYGGGGAQWHAGGGGGSSFISGHAGCDAISASSTSGNVVHTGQSKHYSGLYFTNTLMIDGAGYQWTTAMGAKIGMPVLTGTGTMAGNTGDGQVKITSLR